MGARERLPVGRADVRVRGGGRTPRGAAVVTCERLHMGRGYVRICGEVWAPRGDAVGTRVPLPVDLEGGRLGIEEKHILRWLNGQQRTVHRSRRRMK